jgi:hypothetical protein
MVRSAPPTQPMSRTAGSAFGSTARAEVIAALPAVAYLLRRSAKQGLPHKSLEQTGHANNGSPSSTARPA